MLDEAVHLESYQAAWAILFRLEQARLAAALGVAREAVEHIGSTAVPGLSAKPIVDIMVGTSAFPPPAAWTRSLERLGYEALGGRTRGPEAAG